MDDDVTVQYVSLTTWMNVNTNDILYYNFYT